MIKVRKVSERAGIFVIVGVAITIFNFLIYTATARIINNNDLLWLSSGIGYVVATFLAYILHSQITWKDRRPGSHGVRNFFVWNLFNALIVNPFFTWLFGLMTPVYEFAFGVSSGLGLPFDYAFIQSTGAFCFAALVAMILNYMFYDRLVFEAAELRDK